jgi:hypothetical protein
MSTSTLRDGVMPNQLNWYYQLWYISSQRLVWSVGSPLLLMLLSNLHHLQSCS